MAPRVPIPTTSSRCTVLKARGRHLFAIDDYSLLKGLGTADEYFVRSDTFTVGGHDWSMRFYPDGAPGHDKDYVAVSLDLMHAADVSVICKLGFFPTTAVATPISKARLTFRADETNPTRAARRFLKRAELEGPMYLKDDRVVLLCELTVILGTQVTNPAASHDVQVPPSDLPDDLARLLEHGEGADVAFHVRGEVFRAHKAVLATRSPFFKAKHYGTMAGGDESIITVDDMDPAVFRALLHFIYTDSLPPSSSSMTEDAEEYTEMVKHLVVAADMYGMERMKAVCERILCRSLDAATVASTLALADQHSCGKLKDACIRFIHSSNSRTEKVVASQAYRDIKRSWNSVFVDMWEKSIKHPRMI